MGTSNAEIENKTKIADRSEADALSWNERASATSVSYGHDIWDIKVFLAFFPLESDVEPL
ncbi:MAG: hypothetical protein QXK65_03045 [Candidatus Micrarchaeaceae archaeon]